MPETLDAKLKVFDEQAYRAIEFLKRWLETQPDDLYALARGRHVQGHYRYEDANFLEYDNPTLLAEAAEEVADAIVYISRRLHRLDYPRTSGGNP